jgi:ADP-ribose pyrophosphatase YjhB (NUDIX family)
VNIRPSVLILDRGAFLFLTYNYPEGMVHALPGGGHEPGELLTDTLTREIKEELSVTADIGSMLFVCETPPRGNTPETLHLIFQATLKPGQKPAINPEHTSAGGFKWLKPNELQHQLMYPNILDKLRMECDLLLNLNGTWRRAEEPSLYLGMCPSRNWA